MGTFREERLEKLEKELKPGEFIVFDPCSFIPYISGKGPNRTCGDCGDTDCLNLYYETEFGRLNHGVCFRCWCTRGSEECEGGLLGDPGSDGPSNREVEILESHGINVDWVEINKHMNKHHPR